MKDLIQLKMPAGLLYEKIKALVKAGRLTKVSLKVVREKRQSFATYFTVGALIKKLELTMQTSWCQTT